MSLDWSLTDRHIATYSSTGTRSGGIDPSSTDMGSSSWFSATRGGEDTRGCAASCTRSGSLSVWRDEEIAADVVDTMLCTSWNSTRYVARQQVKRIIRCFLPTHCTESRTRFIFDIIDLENWKRKIQAGGKTED